MNLRFLKPFLTSVSFQNATLPARMRGSSAPSSFLQEKMEELQLNKDKRKEPDWTQVQGQNPITFRSRFGTDYLKTLELQLKHISLLMNYLKTLTWCINVRTQMITTSELVPTLSALLEGMKWNENKCQDYHQQPLPINISLNINEHFYRSIQRLPTNALM